MTSATRTRANNYTVAVTSGEPTVYDAADLRTRKACSGANGLRLKSNTENINSYRSDFGVVSGQRETTDAATNI